MKRRKLMGWVIGIPALVVVLILIIVFYEPEKGGITRAMAAKSVALAVQSPKELREWKKEWKASHFPAKSVDQWYVPYLDYLYEHDYVSEEDFPATEKMAEDSLTYQEAAKLAQGVSPSLEDLIKVNKKNQDQPFPEDLWWLFYDSLVQAEVVGQAIEKTTILIYGTPENIPEISAWTAQTNRGKMGFSGLSLDAYIDHELTVYLREDELIHVMGDNGDQVTYQNVWLIEGNEKAVTLYVGDVTRKIPFQKKSKQIDSLVGNLADIQISGGEITKVSVKKERITGKVLSVNPDTIEIEGYGAIPLDEEFKVLKLYGDLQRQTLEDILVGYRMQEFVAAKGKLCAALTVRKFEADTIRVLLMDDGFQNLSHQAVTISCQGSMTWTQGEETQEIPAGEILEFVSGDQRLSRGRILVEPQSGFEIQVTSINRSQGAPSYAGRLELLQAEEGIVLVNDLYLEEYLKKVVPSEMPSSYETEALKAQAVCARTYAYVQIQSNTYNQYGAHVDDSTNFQVYNNIKTDDRTAAAVMETYGKLLLYEGDPIEAYYFSTSCGVTTDTAIWGSDSEKTPYLKSVALRPGGKNTDLSSNAAFSSFIKDKGGTAYDGSFPFYRWQAVTNAEILTENIGGVGTVTSIQITDRGPGGVAQVMKATGTQGEKEIRGQSAIRSALGDGRLEIKRLDEKTVTGWSTLPSGFLTVEALEPGENGMARFIIYGGGYGHGVGMSQNGAQGMAKDGMECEEILKFFYPGVTVEERT